VRLWVLLLALFASVPALAQQRLLFAPDCFQCEKKLAITETDGKLSVHVPDGGVVQKAMVTSTLSLGNRMTVSYWEVANELPASKAASGWGWKDPEAVFLYTRVVYHGRVVEGVKSVQQVQVREWIPGRWLVVLYTFFRKEKS
jgi:hypothetical protein